MKNSPNSIDQAPPAPIKTRSSGEESYRDSVETLMRLNSSTVFSNGAPIHAAIIFDAFFRHATRSIKIFCKNLCAEVFDSPWLVASAQEALKKGANISIVTQLTAQDSFFTRWVRANASHPGLTFLENAAAPGTSASNLKCNFAVMDGKAYRFEADANAINAVACMNDEGLAAKLEALFSRVLA